MRPQHAFLFLIIAIFIIGIFFAIVNWDQIKEKIPFLKGKQPVESMTSKFMVYGVDEFSKERVDINFTATKIVVDPENPNLPAVFEPIKTGFASNDSYEELNLPREYSYAFWGKSLGEYYTTKAVIVVDMAQEKRNVDIPVVKIGKIGLGQEGGLKAGKNNIVINISVQDGEAKKIAIGVRWSTAIMSAELRGYSSMSTNQFPDKFYDIYSLETSLNSYSTAPESIILTIDYLALSITEHDYIFIEILDRDRILTDKFVFVDSEGMDVGMANQQYYLR